MLQKLFIITEWSIGLISSGAVIMSLLFVMFSDSPSFGNNFSYLQKFVFGYQGLFLIIVPGIFLISFIAQFFVKTIPWNHVVGVAGIVGIIFAIIFFSAYIK